MKKIETMEEKRRKRGGSVPRKKKKHDGNVVKQHLRQRHREATATLNARRVTFVSLSFYF